MRWRKMKTGSSWLQDNAIESDKGYRVIRHNPNQFSAWRPSVATDNGLTLLSGHTTGEAARQACANHYSQQEKL